MYHTRIVDTALLFPSLRGGAFKSSLRVLAREHLGRVIQQGVKGHDSVEDARAALDLALLKINGGVVTQARREELLMDKLRRGHVCAAALTAGYAPKGTGMTTHETDTAVVIQAKEALNQGSKFLWATLGSQEVPGSSAHLQGLDRHLRELYEALPQETFFCVLGSPSLGSELRR